MTPRLKWLAAGTAVLAVAGTAALAGTLHRMTIELPGGGSETIVYSGDVAPQVSFSQAPMLRQSADAKAWNPFAEMERVSAMMDAMAADMDRQMQVSLRQMPSLVPDMTQATLRGLPAGSESYSVTTISTGQGVCTREVRVRSDGARPQVVSQSSGCGDQSSPEAVPGTQTVKAILHDPAVPREHI